MSHRAFQNHVKKKEIEVFQLKCHRKILTIPRIKRWTIVEHGRKLAHKQNLVSETEVLWPSETWQYFGEKQIVMKNTVPGNRGSGLTASR